MDVGPAGTPRDAEPAFDLGRRAANVKCEPTALVSGFSVAALHHDCNRHRLPERYGLLT